MLGPMLGRGFRAEVVSHGAGAGGEERHVGTALALELELRPFEALADLVVADVDGAFDRDIPGLFQRRQLALSVGLHLAGNRRVVSVAIKDHFVSPKLVSARRYILTVTARINPVRARPR